jgi:hypothetical protein
MKRSLAIAVLAFSVTGCNTAGQLTVKDYKAKAGQRVMAGQAEPKAEYQCQKVAQEKQDWGITGNMDRVAASERVTSVAVETAPGKGANYAQIMTPAQVTFGMLNVNAFSDAQVAYYRCANLPGA